ncbi:MAG: phospholipid carrier-dependent glycosyltransferase [Patescibacteria group bacterium]
MPKVTILAVFILTVMFILMLGSAWNDSAIMDELAHIPAGFGYVRHLDFRLNPEHPPLVKAVSALFAQIAVRPHFPTDTSYWRDDVNGQWAQGTKFLYESGNDADRIIFWSRVPMILLTVLFGWLFFYWIRKRFGSGTALMALTFFAFSPTILAHGRFVTTDIGAAFGFFIGVASFLAFLEKPDRYRIPAAGILFGTAQLLKFSVILLIPIYAILLIAWIGTRQRLSGAERLRLLARMAGKSLAIGVIGLAVIWVVYGVFTWNYPQERQLRDAEFLLGSYGFRPAVELDLALVRHRFTRPLGEYLLGLLMVQQRSAGGNTAFFLGQVSAAGSRWYFPLLYLLKEPLPMHILTFVAVVLALSRPRFFKKRGLERCRAWMAGHFPEFAALTVITVYWAFSIRSPLNIGVRHVLPTFPFIYLLVSRQIVRALTSSRAAVPRDWVERLRELYRTYIASLPRYLAVVALLVWLVAGTLSAFPSFLSYYNELAGGTKNGWRIAVDSNYDWGQDLVRLADFVKKNNIPKVSLDHFGGGSPRYYLGERFEPWWSARGPAHGIFAISVSLRQGAWGRQAPGFARKPEDSYEWLRPYEPIAEIGHSILVYDLP